MLASYELYLLNHARLETYEQWCARMKDDLDLAKINADDAELLRMLPEEREDDDD